MVPASALRRRWHALLLLLLRRTAHLAAVHLTRRAGRSGVAGVLLLRRHPLSAAGAGSHHALAAVASGHPRAHSRVASGARSRARRRALLRVASVLLLLLARRRTRPVLSIVVPAGHLPRVLLGVGPWGRLLLAGRGLLLRVTPALAIAVRLLLLLLRLLRISAAAAAKVAEVSEAVQAGEVVSEQV